MNILAPQQRPRRQGFALVIALSLMAFVLMLLLSVTTMVQVEVRNSGTSLAQLQARQNSLLSLNIALGELQKATGPDQRVTAPADILSDRVAIPEARKLVTGVWKAADVAEGMNANQSATDIWNWSVRDGGSGTSRDAETRTDAGSGAWSNGPRWLVSSELPMSDLASDVWETLNPTLSTVPMLESYERTAAGGVGGALVESLAGVVPLNGRDGQVAGGFAWLVVDEGVKAKVNLDASLAENPDFEDVLLDQNRMSRTAFDTWSELSFSDTKWREKTGRVTSSSQLLTLQGTGDNDSARALSQKLGGHWTTSAEGLLVNVRDGGFKKDLSRGLGDEFPQALAGRPMWWYYDAENDDYIQGPHWDLAQNYVNLYRPRPPWLLQVGATGDEFTSAVNRFGFNSPWEYSYVNNDGNPRGPAGVSDVFARNAVIEPRAEQPIKGTGLNKYTSVFQTEQGGSLLFKGTSRLHYGDSSTGFGERIPFLGGEKPVNATNKLVANPMQSAIAPVTLVITMQVGLATAKGSDLWDMKLGNGEFTREKINQALSLGIDPADTSTMNELSSWFLANDGSVFNKLDSNYVVHLVAVPAVVLWNPYNITLNDFDLTVRWIPGLQNYADGDVALIDGDGNRIMMRSGKDHFLLGQPFRTDDASSKLASSSEFKFQISDANLAPGAVQSYSLGEVSYASSTTDLVISQGSVGIVSSALRTDFLPSGKLIRGLQYRLFEQWRYGNRQDWSIETWLGGVNGETGNVTPTEQENSRTLRRSPHLIPEGNVKGVDADYLQRFFEDGPLSVDDLAPPGYSSYARNETNPNKPILGKKNGRYDPLVEMALDLGSVGYLAAMLKPADQNPSQGLPLFTQFNPAATAFMDTSEGHTQGFLWKVDFISEFDLSSFNGIYDVLTGVGNGWGNELGLNGQNEIAIYDVPRLPTQSVGSLMHANLGIVSSCPTYVVGGGYASPLIPSDAVYTLREFDYSNGSTGRFPLPDVSYLSNEFIFDDYFFSSVPESSGNDRALTRDVNRTPPFGEDFDEDYLATGGELPNSRYRIAESVTDPEVMRDFDDAAQYLSVDGAFNVNSTSSLAWKAILGGLNQQRIETIGSGSQQHGDDFPFTRSGFPLKGEGDSWAGYKALTDAELTVLSEAVVAEVKARGPFVSMADFVNRRLVPDERSGQIAALQSALDLSLNADAPGFGNDVSYAPKGEWEKEGMFNSDVLAGKQAAGATGWLLQNDILKYLAPVLTPRSDTFVIRAYGSALTGGRERPDAEAWCEAVVQRIPEYVNGSDAVEIAQDKEWSTSENQWAYTRNAQVSNVDATFGRRYRILSVRWLDKEEL